MDDVEISEYRMPTQVDAEWTEVVRVRNAVETHTIGTDALTMSADELLSIFRDSSRRRARQVTARLDGELVGRSLVWLPAGGTTATGVVDVLPDHRGRGVGAALLEATERIAAEERRTQWQCAVAHPVMESGGRLEPRTGVGTVPADAPGVRFLASHGYRLEQVARVSRLTVDDVAPAPEVDGRWLVHAWTGSTPHRWISDLAHLKSVMSTAAPSGELGVDETTWTDADVREHDLELVDAGRTMLVCTVEDTGSGRLVAFTELEVPAPHADGRARPAVQEDTLVLPEHRGHRLGAIVKAHNLVRLRSELPDVREVLTFNAEENRHMLTVNEALGFRAIGHEGVWEKRV